MFARLTITIFSCKVFRNKRTLLHLVVENMIAVASSIRSLSAHYKGRIVLYYSYLFIHPNYYCTTTKVQSQRYSYTRTLTYFSIKANPSITFSSVNVFFFAYPTSHIGIIEQILHFPSWDFADVTLLVRILYESSKISNFRVRHMFLNNGNVSFFVPYHSE